MKIDRFLTLSWACLAFAGCHTQMPPLNFTPATVGLSSRKHNAELKSLTVSVAQPTEQIGKVKIGQLSTVFGGQGDVQRIWRDALEDSLNRSAIFNDLSPQKVALLVKITQFDSPSFGLTFETKVSAKYDIIDRSSGAIVFTTSVSSMGKVPGDYAFMGVTRNIEAINRAVQNNIVVFLQQLETADLTKVTFPGRNEK